MGALRRTALARANMTVHAGPLPVDHPFAGKTLDCEVCTTPLYNPADGSLVTWGEFGGRVLCGKHLAERAGDTGSYA